MKETILQYVREYAPMVLMLIMIFIDKYGFGSSFTSFRKDITDSFDVRKLTGAIESLRAELRANSEELEDIKEEIKREREVLSKIRGGKK